MERSGHALLGRIYNLPNTTLWVVFTPRQGYPKTLLNMVMKHRHQEHTRRCAHCGQRFTVNPRVGKRHRFCAKPECVRASRNVARKRWLRKGGRKYFGGSVDTQRVRTWRQMNPKYWRRKSRIRRRPRSDYVLTKSLAATLRYVALQDLIDTHLALEIGMISHLSGSALQDVIAKEIRRLMLRGHAILRGKTPKS
jgi:hypothetical protein